MGELEGLRPVEKRRVFDLVEEAGVDVSDWANFSRGAKWAAANPKYCYEWAFVEPRRVVVLNLWHAQLLEKRGAVTWSANLRGWIQRHSGPGSKAIWRKRAEAFESAIGEAARGKLPIRVIVNDGVMRKAADRNAKASTVQRRLLDPIPWAVTSYRARTGQCSLTRGILTKGSVDQFDVAQGTNEIAEQVSVQSTVFVRDPRIRSAALQRANGKCEFCRQAGFTMDDGRMFLETHHVIPLSEGGVDSAHNVAAVCPNHHREAHHGSRAKMIRVRLLRQLRPVPKTKAV